MKLPQTWNSCLSYKNEGVVCLFLAPTRPLLGVCPKSLGKTTPITVHRPEYELHQEKGAKNVSANGRYLTAAWGANKIEPNYFHIFTGLVEGGKKNKKGHHGFLCPFKTNLGTQKGCQFPTGKSHLQQLM